MMQPIRPSKVDRSALQGRPANAPASEGRRTRRSFGWHACLVAVSAATIIGGAIAVVMAQSASQSPKSSDRDSDPEPSTNSSAEAAKSLTSAGGSVDGYLAGGRWREGTKLVDVPGEFKISGESVAFHAVDNKTRFACLENLNSERVARIVGESPETLDWTVQGTITEFKSENYLLVTQAVINTRAVRGPRSPAGRATVP